MISPDVRQAAMVAISRGWFVKSENFSKYPFTRAELALAAGAYQGLLVPTIPDDTTVALRTMIDHLPHSCAMMFTQAEVVCPFCQAKQNGIVPTFSCSTSWKESGWTNLKTALEQAQPFLGYLPKGWHREGCDRDDQCPTVTKLGKWLYLELRPYPVLENDFFPSLKETVSLLADKSLCTEGLCVDSLVCSNLSVGEGRHYWLVEVKEGRMHQAYDSLQGVQPLTQEVYRMLQVTGILLRAAGGSKPTLRNSQLDQIASKVEPVQRRQQTIRVASRSRTHKLRNQLVKSMSSLTLAPVKRGVMPAHAQREGTTSCDGADSVRRLTFRQCAPVGVAKSRKTHKSKKEKGKGGIKNRTRGRNTSKALPFSSTTAKSKGSVSVCKDQNSVRQGEATPAEVVSENPPCSQDVSGDNIHDEQDIREIAAASDPISETFSQPQVLPGSPSKERKRTYAQAELEQVSPGQRVTEDELRRNQGPPNAKLNAEPETDSGDGQKEAIEVKLGSEVERGGQTCQANQKSHEFDRKTLALTSDASKPEPSGVNPGENNSRVEKNGHQSALGTACCRAQPVAAKGDDNQETQCKDIGTDGPVRGRYGVISLFDGVSTVMPILRKKFGYAPVEAILADGDLSLRELVCTEYGYRSDEKWGYTVEGSAVLYLKDVHVVINHNCQLLKELVQMFPDCKWIIVGGSPCQDRRGKSSSPDSYICWSAARYAWPGRYVWDPWDFGFQITRRRNYFRNFDDTEEIGSPTQVFDHNYGPLVDQSGNNVPFAPLLRTRESLPFGILRASWTLYQPHALAWDYAYWNGRVSFAKACKLGWCKQDPTSQMGTGYSSSFPKGLVQVSSGVRKSLCAREGYG